MKTLPPEGPVVGALFEPVDDAARNGTEAVRTVRSKPAVLKEVLKNQPYFYH